MAKESAGKTVSFKVNFDAGSENQVTSRITVDPTALAKAVEGWNTTEALPLGVYYDQQKDAEVQVVNNLLNKYFSNKVVSVVYEQRSSLAVNAEFCAKLNLASTFGQDKQLYFYTYDNTKNIYHRIGAPNYWVDKGGYAHFTAPLGGSIVITDKPLAQK